MGSQELTPRKGSARLNVAGIAILVWIDPTALMQDCLLAGTATRPQHV